MFSPSSIYDACVSRWSQPTHTEKQKESWWQRHKTELVIGGTAAIAAATYLGSKWLYPEEDGDLAVEEESRALVVQQAEVVKSALAKPLYKAAEEGAKLVAASAAGKAGESALQGLVGAAALLRGRLKPVVVPQRELELELELPREVKRAGGRHLLGSSASCSIEDSPMYAASGSVSISATPVGQGVDVVAVGTSGDTLTVFGGADDKIYLTASINGTDTTREVAAPINAIHHLVNPRIVRDLVTDKYFIVFSDQVSGGGSTYFTIVNPDGSEDVAPTAIFSASGDLKYLPDINALESGGISVSQVSTNRVNLAKVSSTGLTQTPPTLSVPLDTSAPRHCGIAEFTSGTNTGKSLLAREEGGQLYFDLLTSGLTVDISNFITARSGTVHSVLPLSNGDAFIAFKDGTNIKAFSVNSAGEATAVKDVCTGSDVTGISLAESPTGEVAITFSAKEPTEENISGRLCSANGTVVDTIGGDYQISNAAGNQVCPASTFAGPDLISAYSDGGTLTQQTLLKNTVPEFDIPPTTKTTTVGASFEWTVPAGSASDLDGHTVTYDVRAAGGGARPGWLNFNGTTLSGIAPAGTSASSVALELVARDGIGESVSPFSLDIDNVLPQIDNPVANQTTSVGASFEWTVPENTASNNDSGQTLTYTVRAQGGGALPGWLNWDGSKLTGTPPAGTSATTVNLELVVSDGVGEVTDEFTLDIENVPPVFTNPPSSSQTLTALVPYSLEIPSNAATNNDSAQALTYSMRQVGGGGLPPWLTFENNILSGTPPAGALGTLALELVVSDGITSVTSPISLSVMNSAPTIPFPPRSVDVPVAIPLYRYNVGADTAVEDSDSGQSLTVSVRGKDNAPFPIGVTWDQATEALFVIPDASWVDTTLELEFVLSDGVVETVESFDVNFYNTPPVLVNHPTNQGITVGEPFSYTPGTTVTDVDPLQTITSGVRARGGGLLPTGLTWDGTTLSGTIAAGAGGHDHAVLLEFYANDGVVDVKQDFALIVQNRPPAFADPIVATTGYTFSGTDTTVSFTPPPADGSQGPAVDIDGDPVVYSAGTGAPTQLVVDPDTGAMIGAGIAPGTYTFSLIATSNGQSVSVPITMTIENASEISGGGGGKSTAEKIQEVTVPIAVVLLVLGMWKKFNKYLVPEETRDRWYDSITKMRCCSGRVASVCFRTFLSSEGSEARRIERELRSGASSRMELTPPKNEAMEDGDPEQGRKRLASPHSAVYIGDQWSAEHTPPTTEKDIEGGTEGDSPTQTAQDDSEDSV